MSDDIIWITASPYLRGLNFPLMKYLSQSHKVVQWEYFQTMDESASLDNAVALLYDFLKNNNNQVHLIGHGIGGVIALLFARKYPQFARSLTLLSVAGQPANTWHAHYYQQRKSLDVSHNNLMMNLARDLFNDELPCCANKIITFLNKDLDTSPLQHSIFKIVNLPKGGVSMPLMVCGSLTDSIVNYQALHDWKRYLKAEDMVWNCPIGGHFFHYFHPENVGEKILEFWQMNMQPENLLMSISEFK